MKKRSFIALLLLVLMICAYATGVKGNILTGEKWYDWNGSEWVIKQCDVYRPDSLGVVGQLVKYTYNSSGVLTGKTTFYRTDYQDYYTLRYRDYYELLTPGGYLRTEKIYLYTFDSNNVKIGYTESSSGNCDWGFAPGYYSFDEVSSYSYNYDGNRIANIEEYYLEKHDYEIINEYTYSTDYVYDTENRITSEIKKLLSGGVWSDIERTVWTYESETGSGIKETYDVDTWVNSVKMTRYFNLDGLYTSELREGWNGNGWVKIELDDLNYDSDGDVIEIITKQYDPISTLYLKKHNIFYDQHTEIAESFVSFDPLSYSASAWGDYDNDGDLDLLITGESATGVYCTKLYNNSAGTFTEVTTGMVNISAGSVAWGDYDNDGDVDILLSGYTGSGGVTKIYRNDGNGTFTDINAGLPGCYYNSVSWGDYDNDGDLDILITGYVNSTTRISKIYRNDGNGVFTDINAGLVNVSSGSAAWGDYDSDGDLDILLTGYSSSGAVSKVYRNDKGVFTDIAAGLTGVFKSSVAWGDYDNDGDLDILLTGMPTTSTYTSKVYRNDGSGTFTDINAGLTSAGYSSAIWTDYDSDGYLDILLSGNSYGIAATKMCQNQLNGTFIDTPHYFEPVKFSSVTSCDYDNDGRNDYLISGSNGTDRVTKLYKSNMTAANTKPSAPSSLSSVVNDNDIFLSWNKAMDAQTPQNGLSYNLYIGTSPLAVNKKSPMSDISTGYRRIVGFGNTQQNNSLTIKDLAPGAYYWSVQSVDNGFVGSLFPTEQMFTIGNVPQNVNITYTAGQVQITWAAVSGALSYKVFSSNDPFGTFADVSSQGTLSGTSWSQTITGNKLFYYVVAVTAKVENINQSVKVKK